MVNKHIVHLEQLSLQGMKELRKAIIIIQKLKNSLYTNNIDTDIVISKKIDGALAIVFGKDKNNKFFISTKSIFNVTPKIAYTIDDIKQLFDKPQVQEKLINCYKVLSTINFDGIYQADFLFDSSSKHIKFINSISYITFTPNTITYAIEEHSIEGQRVKNAQLGICIHTKYVGDPLTGLIVDTVNIQLNQFLNIPSLYVINPFIDNIADNLLTENEYNKISHSLSLIGEQFHTIPSSFFLILENNQEYIKLIERYINYLIKNEYSIIINNKFISNCIMYIDELNISKSLKNNAKQFITEYKKYLITLLHIYMQLMECKIIIIEKLERLNKNLQTFYDIEGILQKAKEEGFCVIPFKNGIVKLIDRFEFSKNNFNFIKRWGENEQK